MTGRRTSEWSSHQRVMPTIALRRSSAIGSSSSSGTESSGWARRSSAKTARAVACTLGAEGPDLRIAGGVPEDHVPGVGLLLDVGKPGVE
jgi:hypothetical protein